MSGWVAGAVVVGAVVGAGASAHSANKASKAAKSAANEQRVAQQNELDYLQDADAMPRQFREGALQQLGGVAGLEGGTGSQQELIDRSRESPLYASIMGQQQTGEEAILRTAGATGGLRSGNAIGAVTDYGMQLENRALLESYNQQLSGLQGLASLPSGAAQIGNTMSDIGRTNAQGITAEANAYQQGVQGVSNAVGTAVGQYAQYRSTI